jgi:hypothetical protein
MVKKCPECGVPMAREKSVLYVELLKYIQTNGEVYRHYANIARDLGEKYPEKIKYHLDKMIDDGVVIIENKIISLSVQSATELPLKTNTMKFKITYRRELGERGFVATAYVMNGDKWVCAECAFKTSFEAAREELMAKLKKLRELNKTVPADEIIEIT